MMQVTLPARKQRLLISVMMIVPLLCVHAGADVPEQDAATRRPDDAAPLVLRGGLPTAWPPAGDPRPYADSVHAERIDKALAYLLFKERGEGRRTAMVVLDYLRRKFGLHERYGKRTTCAPHLIDAKAIAEDDHFFKRFMDRDYAIPLEALEARPLYERPLLRALFCHIYPVDEVYFQEMDEILAGGEHQFLLTGALAFLVMKGNDCMLPDAQLILLRDRIGVQLRDIAQAALPNHEIAYHAVALLYGIGLQAMVSHDWIVAIAEAQHEDGGWSAHRTDDAANQSDGLATVQAVWALFEHALPGRAPIPFMPTAEHAANSKDETTP